MYSYIYDSYLSDKKYEKSLVRLENMVTDLGINGPIHKLSILKSLREIVQDEIAAGVNTIVTVGNDNTITQIIDVIAKKNITLGIIPMGQENKIASALGITSDNAIESLSKRVTQKIDLGKVNDIYFLSSLQITNTNAIIQSSGYKIEPRFSSYNIDIYNFILTANNQSKDLSPQVFNPLDGTLEAVIYKGGKESFVGRLFKKQKLDISTFLPFKKLKIKNPFSDAPKKEGEEETKVLVDEQKIIKLPLEIEVAPSCLKVIVGKDRNFD
ncbi:MAG: diacylglycerol kinase family protein [bacterium]